MQHRVAWPVINVPHEILENVQKKNTRNGKIETTEISTSLQNRCYIVNFELTLTNPHTAAIAVAVVVAAK